MRQIYTYIIICLILVGANTQLNAQNLIRNGSFEDAKIYDSKKILWSITKQHFDLNMKYWTSPTGGTPDIILDSYRGNPRFERSGLDIKPCLPRTGESIVAIRSFGCKNNTPHCREYLQAKTEQILKEGCTYQYEFFAQPAVSSIRINNLGIAFTEYGINDITNDQMLDSDNVQLYKEIINSNIGEWVRIAGEYTMDKNYNFILIGNFFDDENTKHRKIKGGMATAYYLIDDVSLFLKSCPNEVSTPLLNSNIILIDNIIFDNDSAALKSNLKNEYQKIIKNNFSSITINGYTDDSGTDSYNLKLSKERANSVLEELVKLGIPRNKMTAVGYGNANQIDKVNKAKNRRVEIIVD